MGHKHSVEYRPDPAVQQQNEELRRMIMKQNSAQAELHTELAKSRQEALDVRKQHSEVQKQLELLSKQLEDYRKSVLLPKSVTQRLGKSADALVREAKEYYKAHGIDLNMCKMLLAIVGASGTGKSSLINAMRGLDDWDEGAAEVGVQEMVIRPTLYDYASSMALVDFPGGATSKFPGSVYVMEFKMYCFDVILVLFNSRITELCVDIAKEMREFGRRTLFLRSKCDNDVTSILRSKKPGSIDRAGAKQLLRQQTEESLKKNIPWANVNDLFLVSAATIKHGAEFDEALLLTRLQDLAAMAAKQQ